MVLAGRVEKGMSEMSTVSPLSSRLGGSNIIIEVKHQVRLLWASADDHPC